MNDAIVELARNTFLRNQLKIKNDNSKRYNAMEDVEMVLRFLALHERTEKFSGNLSREMDLYIGKYQNASVETIETQKQFFLKALRRCERIWGDFAFKRPERESWRDQLLSGMYDAQMLGAMRLSSGEYNKAIAAKIDYVHKTRILFKDKLFDQAKNWHKHTTAA